MTSFDFVRIRDVWKRLFDMDIEKKRRTASLPVGTPVGIGQHLQQLEKSYPETPFADRLLAEIEIERVEQTILLVLSKIMGMVKLGWIEPAARKVRRRSHKLGPQSTKPGVTAIDVFRIFSNECQIILTDADWREVPEVDRRAILAEAARWVFDAGVFPGDGQWRRTTSDGAILDAAHPVNHTGSDINGATEDELPFLKNSVGVVAVGLSFSSQSPGRRVTPTPR